MALIETNGLMTTQEFADAVGLTTDTVKIYCQRGTVAATKVGGKHGTWVIPKAEVKRFQTKRKPAGRPTR